jgi:hypothetical protein
MMALGNFLAKKRKTAEGKKLVPLTGAIFSMVKAAVSQVFVDHKLELLDKEPSYIISSVFGAGERGPLTNQQQMIHDKVNPAVCSISEALKTDQMSVEQKSAILFITRMLIVFKIMFTMELFRNKWRHITTQEKDIQESLEKMKVIGNA